jgi:natural product precursor
MLASWPTACTGMPALEGDMSKNQGPKQPKKLKVNRQSVRVLSSEEMAKVKGGGKTIFISITCTCKNE